MNVWEEYYKSQRVQLDEESYNKILKYAVNLHKRYENESDVSYEGIILTSIEEQGDMNRSVSDEDFERLIRDLKKSK